MNYQQAQFLLSAVKLEHLPDDQGIEIAFAGRSNAGKSSALNVLTRQKNLARTSKTPGRTQAINLFTLDEHKRIVDLPGYGYAKVSMKMKLQWQATLAKYLDSRDCLKGLVLLMDIRHPLKEFDQQMIQWAHSAQLPVHILLSKSDKLKKGAAKSTLLQVRKDLQSMGEEMTVQSFSALKREGVELLQEKLDSWFHPELRIDNRPEV